MKEGLNLLRNLVGNRFFDHTPRTYLWLWTMEDAATPITFRPLRPWECPTARRFGPGQAQPARQAASGPQRSTEQEGELRIHRPVPPRAEEYATNVNRRSRVFHGPLKIRPVSGER